jgi:hypothetical protein
MMFKVLGKEKFRELLEQKFSDDDYEIFVDSLTNFDDRYDEWYSESISLIKQLLPERLADFKSFYDVPKTRKYVDHSNYVIRDYMLGLRRSRGSEIIVDQSSALPKFKQQLAILKAARKRFESSLFEIRQLVQADLFDNELDAARELLKNRFCRAAGAVAGVVLERHLKQVCDDHAMKISSAKPGLAVLNQALRDGDVIDIPQWRHIQHLADIRNLCGHSRKNDPTNDQVIDFISGVDKIIKTIL